MKWLPVLPLACLAALLVTGPETVQAEDHTEVTLFPGKSLFPLFTADALQHTISLSHITKNRDWIGAIGASIPVLELTGGGYAIQASVEASKYTRLVKSPGHLAVYTLDYRVDFPFSLRLGRLALRAGYGHISCHFLDDAIEMQGRRPIQSIKDYVRSAVAYDVPRLGGYVYAGVDYIYHIIPYRDRRWQLQFGGEGGNLLLADVVRLYAAIDVKVKQQVGWGTTQSYQVGMRFHVKKDLPVRIAYTYRTGLEERGQFFDQKEDVSLLGVYFDL